MGNPLLPARAEGTLLWINPCMFRAVRADPPWPTWSVLAFARFCWSVRGANTDMCQILRKCDTKSRAVHSCPALYDNKVVSGVRVCLRAHSIQCAWFGHYARGQRSRLHDSTSVFAGRTPICIRYLVEKERAAFTSHTCILPNVVWSRLYRPPYAFRAVWASCWLFPVL